MLASEGRLRRSRRRPLVQVDRLLIKRGGGREGDDQRKAGSQKEAALSRRSEGKKKYNQQQRLTLKYLLVRRGRGQLIEPRPRGCHRLAFVMFSEVETWASDGKEKKEIG